jgi:hypothetical protein
MANPLKLKKVTIRNVDEHLLDRMGGGTFTYITCATQTCSCACTAPTVCECYSDPTHCGSDCGESYCGGCPTTTSTLAC